MQVLGLLDNLFIKSLIEMWNEADGALETDLQIAQVSLLFMNRWRQKPSEEKIRMLRDEMHTNKIRQKFRLWKKVAKTIAETERIEKEA